MQTSGQSQQDLPAGRSPALVDHDSDGLHRLWRRYENSALPLGLKWSFNIATLIVIAMGALGFLLIQQQEDAYRGQADRFSRVIVTQLGGISGEPLMAADSLTLQNLLQRHVHNPLVLGAELRDTQNVPVAHAGGRPPPAPDQPTAAAPGGMLSWEWSNDEHAAVSYQAPVPYQDVVAGYLTLTFDRSPLEADLQRTVRVLVVSTLLLISIGVMLASVLAYRLSRPIEHLARAGKALAPAGPARDTGRRDEIGQVLESFRHLAEGVRRKNYAEDALSRYVSPQIARHVLAAAESEFRLGGDSVEGSVLFCDIVGFTELSEGREPAEVAALLNDYFGYFAAAAESCGGTVDKFIGDCIMIVFGVPQPDPHHALHAMTCGMLIQHLARRLNAIRSEGGEAAVRFRVGISSGPMLAGNLGSTERMQFTVVGDTVNVAARVCGMAEPGGVMVTEAMLAAGFPGDASHYRPLGPVAVRGRRDSVEIRAMDADAVAHQLNADRLIRDILPSAVDA